MQQIAEWINCRIQTITLDKLQLIEGNWFVKILGKFGKSFIKKFNSLQNL